MGSNIENFYSYSLNADDNQRAIAVEKDVSLVLMVVMTSLLLLCEENKQVLQRTEEMHSKLGDLLPTRSGSEENYSTSRFSGLH